MAINNVLLNMMMGQRVDSGSSETFKNAAQGVSDALDRRDLRVEEDRLSDLRTIGSMAYGGLQLDDDLQQQAFLKSKAAELSRNGKNALASRIIDSIALPKEQRNADLQNILMSANEAFGGGRGAMTNQGEAKPSITKGSLMFKDSKGNYFSTQTYQDPENALAQGMLTNINGTGNGPVGELQAVSPTTGMTQQEQIDFAGGKSGAAETGKIKAQIAQMPLLIAAETDPKKQQALQVRYNELLGAERNAVEKEIRSSAKLARRGQSNLLRLNRALKALETGRLAAAQQIAGTLIPGIRDADAETFLALATQFTLDELARMPGVKTDFDYKKAQDTQAQLGNTMEANRRIVNIAMDRMDDILTEDRQLKAYLSDREDTENFEYKPVPIEHIQILRKNPNNKKLMKDFLDEYGYLPTGL